MPFRVPFSDIVVYSKHEIDRLSFATGTGGAGAGDKTFIVDPGDWTADDSEHLLAPQTFYFTDLAHNFGNINATAVEARDSNGFISMRFEFQRPKDGDDENTLRVWLAFPPAYTMQIRVTG